MIGLCFSPVDRPEASQHWKLQAETNSFSVQAPTLVPSVGKKVVTFKRPMRTSQNCFHQCLCLCSEPQPSPTSVRDPLLSGHLAQSLWSHCFFPWVFMCETLCVPSKSGVCFPQPCRFTVLKPHLSSKSYSLRAPSVTRPPGWGAWYGAQNFPSCGRSSVA